MELFKKKPNLPAPIEELKKMIEAGGEKKAARAETERISPERVKKKPAEEAEEKPIYAPLFVKLNKYRQILNVLGQMKTTIVILRNSFATLDQLEKAKAETLSLMRETVDKLREKIAALDRELIRPAGFRTFEEPEYKEAEAVEATLADLKGQIEQLKAELESMS